MRTQGGPMATSLPTPTAIRNVAVVGHSSAGKTTLVEAFLHRAGVITRPGTIEDGTTVTDHEPEEQARGISVSLGIAHLNWTVASATYDVTLLDAPGYPDFVAGVDSALAVADVALVVVSAVHGVQAGTVDVWRRCVELGLPRIVVVTKEDRARADFRTVVDQLRQEFGEEIVALELPLGEEARLHGVADVLEERALEYGLDGIVHDGPVPEYLAAEERKAHDALVEDIVTHDDVQLERYLSGDEPPACELEETLACEVRDLEAFPVVLCSGLTEVGIDRVLDLLCLLAPAPSERPTTVAVPGAQDPTMAIDADPAADALVAVFRTMVDPFVGQVSVFKVLCGTVGANDKLVNIASGVEERMHAMFLLRGREHDPVEKVVAGQIAAVAKLSSATTGTLLATRRAPVQAVPLPERPPVYRLALRPVSQADDDKLSGSLARLCTEDPTLHVDLTGTQAVIGGLGDTHLAVALDRLARSFGVHVETEPVAVPYRETITRPVESEGKVKKQSGGHGQFAVVQMRVSPLPRGGGVEFVDSTVGGSVPRNYLAAVEKGIHDAMATGGPRGYPVADLRVEVYDGKSHSVDSSDMAFRTAAAAGVREALAAAGTVVLEPVSAVEVTVPVDGQGDVMGDLSARRGRITSTRSTDDGRAVVEALVPEAELARYVLDLRSLTGGRGSFTMRPDSYEAMAAAPVSGSAAG